MNRNVQHIFEHFQLPADMLNTVGTMFHGGTLVFHHEVDTGLRTVTLERVFEIIRAGGKVTKADFR